MLIVFSHTANTPQLTQGSLFATSCIRAILTKHFEFGDQSHVAHGLFLEHSPPKLQLNHLVK